MLIDKWCGWFGYIYVLQRAVVYIYIYVKNIEMRKKYVVVQLVQLY